MRSILYFFYKLSDREKKLLHDNISFYRNLTPKEKRKFEYRVARFIDKHHFIPRGDVIITPVKQVIIASIAIKLTFRMRNYLYDHFKNIIVYPKNYFSIHTKKMHKGETNPKAKTIVFSWDNFVEGIKIEDDNLNLGIHEFTHALFFSFLKQNNLEAMRFIRNHKRILRYLEDKSVQKEVIAADYFRSYAYENQHEFLAVITENYFETPEVFKEKLPALFRLVNKMYRIY